MDARQNTNGKGLAMRCSLPFSRAKYLKKTFFLDKKKMLKY